jgi:hypothetical protein
LYGICKKRDNPAPKPATGSDPAYFISGLFAVAGSCPKFCRTTID